MGLRRLLLAALLGAASLAIIAGAVSGQILVIPPEPPEPLDTLTAELLKLWQEGKDAAGEPEYASSGGACAGLDGRACAEEADAPPTRLTR